ncbi:MAG: hypothetical protein AAGA57_06265 [Planctomycetota bacterium]
MTYRTKPQSIRQATGEQLLLMSIFGHADNQQRIDQELDRRARQGVTRRHPARNASTRPHAA